MKKISIVIASSLLFITHTFGQQTDSLVRAVAMYRYVPYTFITRAKLQPESIQKQLEKSVQHIPAPDEIITMAYDPTLSKRDFQLFIDEGCDNIIQVLQEGITNYKQVGKDQLDPVLYEKNKKAAKDSFETALRNENPEWYDFYVIKKGVTEDWNKDRDMLTDIMNSKSYQIYMYALADARRAYEAPYFKLHQDLVEVRSNILLYRMAAIKLYVKYHKNRTP